MALLKKDGGEGADTADEATCITKDEDVLAGKGSVSVFKNRYDERVRKQKKNISAEAFDFFEQIGFEIPADLLEVRDERIFMMPRDIPSLGGLRIMRSGLLLGEMKKGRFEPSQALACALNASEYPIRIDLSSEGTDVIRYLKCESIEIPEDTPDGYVLVCCDGFALGWGKAAGGRFKNKYLPGWRMM